MAKRDPNKTARNKRIAELKLELRALLPRVRRETGVANESSLNAKIGGKAGEFIDLKNEVITSPEQYASLWLEGLENHRSSTGFRTSYDDLYDLLNGSKAAQEYLLIFLHRSYLNHYDELVRTRPGVDEAEWWIGQNNAHYGLLVTPRFRNGAWENDKSEIRHFKPRYWSVGHVLETGLVLPHTNKVQKFADVDAYLDFFENVIVRHSGSKYQIAIAERYSAFVRAAPDPLAVPLLIPELRYAGLTAKHLYRLDFCIIDPFTLNKVGIELSPASSHAAITGAKTKTQKEINAEVAAAFDKEMKKHKDFFRHLGIFTMIYTDADLANIGAVFADIAKYLTPALTPKQLNFHILDNFFST
jgi:hypothetical protein